MKYKIQPGPGGVIKGGSFIESFFPEKNNLHYELHCDYQIFFWWSTFSNVGDQEIDQDVLKSSRYSKVGTPILIGPVSGKIIAVKNNIATAQIMVSTYGSGIATFDLSQEYVQLNSINARVSWGPVSDQLIVLPVSK